MATQAAVVRRRNGGKGDRQGKATRPAGLATHLWRWWPAGLAVLVVAVAVAGFLFYRALDRLYPQELWRYFRPVPQAIGGSILYRDLDGRLLLAPVGDLSQAKAVTAGPAGGSGGREIVRDAVVLPGGRSVAYLATERPAGQAERDHLKVVGLDGTIIHDVPVDAAAGEPIRSVVYPSVSGRYLAVTSRDRSHVYYYDLQSDAPPAQGEAGTPPEPIPWYRNADMYTGPFPGRPAFAASPDGRQRAQLREGTRRAPACNVETQCELVTELFISPDSPGAAPPAGAPGLPAGTAARSNVPAILLYGAFNSFSAEGWGPIPSQLAGRFYGRVVWSPDSAHLLFTTLDETDMRLYAISTDGKTQPRLLLQSAEALDWIP